MAPIPSLTRFRKFELIEIAEALGLSTEGLRLDIEARIKTYLLENDVSDNAKVVALLNAPRGTTPRKRTSRSTSPSGVRSTRSASRLKNMQAEALTPTKTFQRAGQEESSEDEDRKVETKIERPNQPEFFIDAPEAEKLKTVFHIEKAEEVSPFKSEVKRLVVTEKVQTTEEYQNSQVWSVLLLLLGVELIVLLYSSSFASKVEHIEYHLWQIHSSLAFSLPDFCQLVVCTEFWRPVVTWLLVLVVVPVALSYVVNVERDHPTFSPLTFSVTRSAIIYALGDRDDIFGLLYALVPSSMLHITCAIGLVLATYRGVTKP
ncbi:hypothetical protein K493DRAFT_354633 [Basidiobolus meristosporus CBS 931.73]|uniref:SAP domain-containing protein n=1 Tax=Basidiobolus meristosporus CBS 931.73 TaxID=1314790 RepID=A0A1Y1Y2U8_9FUNG|nr:hypothetical protein K493DRAFT_354633 [Basidiobolus meristosporus CBS 931.73]|eukprot:ORX92342.1 hypothetical protein K493DRAFT_354633 [Basidiobolus meristosporus CBS 931.73]